MNILVTIDAVLVGLFAFAAIHNAIHWWFSRNERVFLVFAIQCAVYAVFSWTMLSRHQATTIADAQITLDRNLTLAVLVYVVVVQFYALLGQRRDHAFRALVTGVLVCFAILHQWAPLRGTVVELQAVHLPGGETTLLPIRTAPGVALALYYATVLVVQVYGLVVARTIWRRGDRMGALLIIAAALTIEASGVLAVLVDFAGIPSPHIGAAPHGFFVLCMALFISREYAARGKRELVANRQFETVFEHAPIGMALLAPSGQVLRGNRALCGMLGTSAAELCTQRIQDLIPHDVELAIAIETSLVRKDGTRARVLIAISEVPDDDGHPTRIAQIQDITELTRTRELGDAKDAADRANAAKSAFLAHLSHEIRTPLGVMMVYAHLLHHYAALDEPDRKKVDIIQTSGKQLAALLDDVLEMSKIEAGRAGLVEDRFDPRATIDEVQLMFAAHSADRDIELTTTCTAELPRALHGDGGKVKRIVINLVSNAVKFTSGGTIRIAMSATALADERVLVTIVVADTGIGIAAPDFERVFEAFEQLAPGARAGGTGLGLAISRTHARLMGGDLTVESAPDVGTTFTVTFVAKSVGVEAGAVRESVPSLATGTAPCKVLVVDDVEHNRDGLAQLLSQASFETRTAADGPGALAIHDDWYPDLVLVDLLMPGMNGLEAIRRMRAAGSGATIGVLSASGLATDEREALAIGADFFMRRPYDERELFDQIARARASRDADRDRHVRTST